MNMYRMFVRPTGAAGEQGARLMARSGGRMAHEAVTLLRITDPAWAVLEIGFGPGLGLQALARQVPDGRVVGIDPSPLMHSHAARRNATGIKEGRIELLDGEEGPCLWRTRPWMRR